MIIIIIIIIIIILIIITALVLYIHFLREISYFLMKVRKLAA